MNISDLETLAAQHASDREELSLEVTGMQIRLDDLKQSCMPVIRTAVGKAMASRVKLYQAIQEAVDEGLFRRPKTRVLAGIKLGIRKKKGKIEIGDEEKVIKRIRNLLPDDQVELLIRTRESVDKNAVMDLTVDDLKRLGIKVIDDSEEIVLQTTDTEIDKFVDALLASDDEDIAA